MLEVIRLKSKRFLLASLGWLALGIWDFIDRYEWPTDDLHHYRWIGFLLLAVGCFFLAFRRRNSPSD